MGPRVFPRPQKTTGGPMFRKARPRGGDVNEMPAETHGGRGQPGGDRAISHVTEKPLDFQGLDAYSILRRATELYLLHEGSVGEAGGDRAISDVNDRPGGSPSAIAKRVPLLLGSS